MCDYGNVGEVRTTTEAIFSTLPGVCTGQILYRCLVEIKMKVEFEGGNGRCLMMGQNVNMWMGVAAGVTPSQHAL